MTKSNDRGTRKNTGEEESIHKFTDADRTRVAIGNRKRMDIDHYLNDPIYKNKTLFWASSAHGDVERWLAAGAEPVPKKGVAGKVFKGINDRQTDEYEIAHSVSVGKDGVSEDNYLLFLPSDEYQKLRINPHQARNAEIRQAMGIGKADSDSVTMPHVQGLKTYAPNVGGGETGLSTRQGGELTHSV